MTTKINITKDPNSNAVSVDFVKGITLQDFVSYLSSLPGNRSKIYLYDYEVNREIYYENGKITNDTEPIFSIYSDYYIKDISGYVEYGHYCEIIFTISLTEHENSESEFIEDSKDDLSDSSYRNRTINIIRDTWVYGVYDKYCSLDLTKLSNKGLHALENSLINLDFIFNQIEKGRYEE